MVYAEYTVVVLPGTIQAFVKTDFVPEYKKATESIFGEGACHVLKIRKYGGVKVL